MMFFNETKLDPLKSPPKIAGYESIVKSRNRNGGGVAIYFQANLNLAEFPLNSRFEVIAVTLDNTLFIALYNPCNFIFQEADIVDLLETKEKTIIIGDFNCRNVSWGDNASNHNGKKLEKICHNRNYNILTPDEPTFHKGNSTSILDIAVSNNVYISAIEVLEEVNTEHRPVIFTLDDTQSIPLLPEKKRRNYDKADWPQYKKSISENLTLIRNITSTEQIDSTIESLTQCIVAAADKHIPWIQKPNKNLPPQILQMIRERNSARRRWQRNPTQENQIELHNKKHILEEALKIYNTEQWNRRINADIQKKGNVFNLIRYRKNQTSRLIPGLKDQNNTLKHSPEEKAEIFAENLQVHHTMTANYTDNNTRLQVENTINNFNQQNHKITEEEQITIQEIRRIISATKPYKAPGPDGIQNILLKKLPRKGLVQIYYICRACLELNHFPQAWKEAVIIPIKKPGKDSHDPNSYRPISLISNLGKILEKTILNRLKKFDDKLQEAQFGFRQNRTTELQLATVIDEAMNNILKGNTTALATLDLEKAYDTIWHNGLIFKLIKLDLPGHLIKIIKNYITERNYQVAVSGTLSTKHHIPAGVPQGSTLSPTLFLFYTYDVPERNNTKLRLFADDTAITTTSINAERACRNLQDYLDTLSDYYRKWCLKVNPQKSKIITFNYKRQQPRTKVYFEDTHIPHNTNLKYLGVTLDKRLNFNIHTQEIHKRARMALYYIWPYLKPEANIEEKIKTRLITTYVRPILTYAAPVWSSTKIANFLRLETIENHCLRLIQGYKASEISNEELWYRANWTRLCHIIGKRTLSFFNYKIKALTVTENIGSTEIPDHVRKIKGKVINQLIKDHDRTT